MAKKSATNKDSDSKFAVIHTGGKQYIVSVGQKVKIEKIKGDFNVGDEVVFDKVLLKGDDQNAEIGMPYIAGSKVVSKLEKIDRLEKVLVVKYKQKARYLKRNGHRQPYFEVLIQEIK